jgi:hypothetical protein
VEDELAFRRQPQEHVGTALALAAGASELVDHGLLDPNLAQVSGSNATVATGSVALIASNAASLMTMRTIRREP